MFKDIIIHESEANRTLYSNIESILYEVFRNFERSCSLYNCNAEILEYKGFLVLVSYRTPIAVYAPDNATLYDCLRIVYGYTATSAQHISKFSKWLAMNNYPLNSFVRFRE